MGRYAAVARAESAKVSRTGAFGFGPELRPSMRVVMGSASLSGRGGQRRKAAKVDLGVSAARLSQSAGKATTRSTQLARQRFRANVIACDSGLTAYNLGNLSRRLVLPLAIQSWSLTSPEEELFNAGRGLAGVDRSGGRPWWPRHQTHPIRHAAARRELRDIDSLPATPRAYRATRVANRRVPRTPPGYFQRSSHRGRDQRD